MPLSPEDLDQTSNGSSGTSHLDSETQSTLLSGGLVQRVRLLGVPLHSRVNWKAICFCGSWYHTRKAKSQERQLLHWLLTNGLGQRKKTERWVCRHNKNARELRKEGNTDV